VDGTLRCLRQQDSVFGELASDPGRILFVEAFRKGAINFRDSLH
jgi:hypothetical protein